MEMKKVLIFIGKFPSFGEDTDGGSILIYSLIELLKDNCVLDIIFTRTPRQEFIKIDGVRNVSYETYEKRLDNKFERRLQNETQLFGRLKKVIDDYDAVIITHCSKAFGIESLTKEEQNKIVLFPMYLSTSYARSGEIPPSEYVEEERKALMSAGKVLTPSDSEKLDMINDFGVNRNKIKVIPRGYSNLIKQNVKDISTPVELLYIASIKEQKNTVEAIEVLKDLLDNGIEAKLHLAGGYQSEAVLSNCKRFIEKHGLENKVVFHGVLSQKDLAMLISQVHINISVSNWETYGRGIFEGMAGGLPTVVYDRLDCIKQYVTDGNGIKFVPSHDAFVLELVALCKDNDYYKNQAQKAIASVEYLSEYHERERLLKELL